MIFLKVTYDIITILIDVLTRNSYTNSFCSLHEFDINEESQILLKCDAGLDRVFDTLTAYQVAAIWSDENARKVDI